MKECIAQFIGGILIGAVVMYIVGICYINQEYKYPMHHLGIERFQRCEINTTNCHSNWYEIVYEEKR